MEAALWVLFILAVVSAFILFVSYADRHGWI